MTWITSLRNAVKFLQRGWPLFAWFAFVAFILLNGCMPKEIRNWNREHPVDDVDCGKKPTWEMYQSMALPRAPSGRRFDMLRSLVLSINPAYDIYLTNNGRPKSKGWIYTGWVWEGNKVFVRKLKGAA